MIAFSACVDPEYGPCVIVHMEVVVVYINVYVVMSIIIAISWCG